MRVCDHCRAEDLPGAGQLVRVMVKITNLDAPTGQPEANQIAAKGPFDVCGKCLARMKTWMETLHSTMNPPQPEKKK